MSEGVYTVLGKKDLFNMTVRHIKTVLSCIDTVNPKKNTADVINALLAEKKITEDEVLPLFLLLCDEVWHYHLTPYTVAGTIDDVDALVQTMERLAFADVVFGYHHPDLGFLVCNPKSRAARACLESFRSNELLLIAVGLQNRGVLEQHHHEKILQTIVALLENQKVHFDNAFLKGPFQQSTEKKKRRASPKKNARSHATKQASSPDHEASPSVMHMSQLISVPVSNELFHNGNVEAWKRIIRSYNKKYPQLTVHIFYDGERIADINSLFKWGKVKHGSVIQFAVAGESLKDLSKLSRYFREGASSRFEAFLQGSPDAVLNLF